MLELATLLGIKYKRDQSGGFIHSNVITVLNKAGEIVHRQEGLQQDMASTLEAIAGPRRTDHKEQEEYYALEISRPGLLSPGYYRLFSRVSAPHYRHDTPRPGANETAEPD